jgi:anion-transporting  ArsA/GET3 family ATPase
MGLIESLESAKVIVSTGTGGVGKTTISAALGAVMARRGKKVLVLTIDPAKRLAQALGLNEGIFEPILVPEASGKGAFYASMIDPKRIFDRFVEKFSPQPEITAKLKANRLYQQLVTALTGSQEFTSMDRLLSEVEKRQFDLVILDTPPTQNAVDFLRAPKRVVGLFDERITKWFIQGGGKVPLFSRIVSRGTKAAVAALEKVTGSEFLHELSDFFEQMSYLQGQVKERSRRVEELLKGADTRFLVVAGADEQKLEETKSFLEELGQSGFHSSSLLLNRAYPEWFSQGDFFASDGAFFNEAVAYYQERRQRLERFENENSFISIFRLADSGKPLNGVKDIVKLSEALEVL